MKIAVNPKRLRLLSKTGKTPASKGPVLYWMSRDQRVQDNWALLAACAAAQAAAAPLYVIFCLQPTFLGAALRQYHFMLHGLEQVREELANLNIPFLLLQGEPAAALSQFCQEHQISQLYTDFSPLRIGRQWREQVTGALKITVYEVDAHNIVPAWIASDKQEVGARTLRPKLTKLQPEFLDNFPKLPYQDWAEPQLRSEGWSAESVLASLPLDRSVKHIAWAQPGSKAAVKMLANFFTARFDTYAEGRNDPNAQAETDLSPYLHFGQLSAQRVILELQKLSSPDNPSFQALWEQLSIRKELADNFCLYSPHYDQFAGFPNWAQKTLNAERSTPRAHLYSLEEFEQALTHDPLWNAAQKEMLNRGKMHGYMRMYWAKKILEWTESPEIALEYAIYLNDKYELDGRDPNGYAGIAWAIGGVHDRPWAPRPVYGNIRYMNDKGAARKFDVAAYINHNS